MGGRRDVRERRELPGQRLGDLAAGYIIAITCINYLSSIIIYYLLSTCITIYIIITIINYLSITSTNNDDDNNNTIDLDK